MTQVNRWIQRHIYFDVDELTLPQSSTTPKVVLPLRPLDLQTESGKSENQQATFRRIKTNVPGLLRIGYRSAEVLGRLP